jgi:membrane-bound serine protease (ClpP class)
MDHLTIALVLIGLGVLMLLAEILLPTGGFLVVGALLFFTCAVGIIMYHDAVQGAVALVGLAVALPAVGYASVAAWRRMSLDSALDAASAAPVPPVLVPEVETLKGRTGKTVSPLRPSGSVEFDGKRIDAMTEGTMLDAGVWVRCVEVRRGQVIVRKMDEPSDVPVLNLGAEPPPKAAPPADEQPRKDEPKKDDFDDFDIGLDKI